MTTEQLDILTTGDISRRLGVSESSVRRTLDAEGVAKRVGRNRVITAADLPRVEEMLRARGYLKPAAAAV